MLAPATASQEETLNLMRDHPSRHAPGWAGVLWFLPPLPRTNGYPPWEGPPHSVLGSGGAHGHGFKSTMGPAVFAPIWPTPPHALRVIGGHGLVRPRAQNIPTSVDDPSHTPPDGGGRAGGPMDCGACGRSTPLELHPWIIDVPSQPRGGWRRRTPPHKRTGDLPPSLSDCNC